MKRGGTVLYMLSQGTSGDALRSLMQRQTVKVEEAEVDDYALLGEIKFTHPLFAVFSHPRYNDFTKSTSRGTVGSICLRPETMMRPPTKKPAYKSWLDSIAEIRPSFTNRSKKEICMY